MVDLNVAIYVRVSKNEQRPENQRLILEEYAKRSGWQYTTFEEKESTRKTRPVKEAVIDSLRKRQFDGILILKLDRFARSLQELIPIVDELTRKGIAFISYRENLDFSTAAGKLQFNILGAFAEFERDLIRERTLDGLARAKSEGKIRGRHPKDCGCGLVQSNGRKHDGNVKPIKENGIVTGWNYDTTNMPKVP